MKIDDLRDDSITNDLIRGAISEMIRTTPISEELLNRDMAAECLAEIERRRTIEVQRKIHRRRLFLGVATGALAASAAVGLFAWLNQSSNDRSTRTVALVTNQLLNVSLVPYDPQTRVARGREDVDVSLLSVTIRSVLPQGWVYQLTKTRIELVGVLSSKSEGILSGQCSVKTNEPGKHLFVVILGNHVTDTLDIAGNLASWLTPDDLEELQTSGNTSAVAIIAESLRRHDWPGVDNDILIIASTKGG